MRKYIIPALCIIMMTACHKPQSNATNPEPNDTVSLNTLEQQLKGTWYLDTQADYNQSGCKDTATGFDSSASVTFTNSSDTIETKVVAKVSDRFLSAACYTGSCTPIQPGNAYDTWWSCDTVNRHLNIGMENHPALNYLHTWNILSVSEHKLELICGFVSSPMGYQTRTLTLKR